MFALEPSPHVESLCRVMNLPPVEPHSEKFTYCIVKMEGSFARQASQEEISQLATHLLTLKSKGSSSSERAGGGSGGDSSSAEEASEAPRPPTVQLSQSTGPCCYCSATTSPQWRRGPPTYPVLCNACGTRYRRSNMLAPLRPRQKKRVRGKE